MSNNNGNLNHLGSNGTVTGGMGENPSASNGSNSKPTYSTAPVTTFKFNFSAGADDAEADEQMQDDEEEVNSVSPQSAIVIQRPARIHTLADAIPLQKDETGQIGAVEIITLHPSSTFTVTPLSQLSSSSSTSSSSSSSSALSPSLLHFRKRAAYGAHTALHSMLDHSDIITQVYEGGFKVWECSIDLILFLQAQLQRALIGGSSIPIPSSSSSTPSSSCPLLFPTGLDSLRVAELGCGHAFPALYCLQRGARFVAMQDYNEEVIRSATIDNTTLNAAQTQTKPRTREQGKDGMMSVDEPASMTTSIDPRRVGFYSGDWSDPNLLAIMGPASYDLILTSDTLYSTSYMLPLFNLLIRLLSSTGVALIAAKRYYFGIGGSTMEFCELVERLVEGKWECMVVDTIEDGKSNIREILLLRRKMKM